MMGVGMCPLANRGCRPDCMWLLTMSSPDDEVWHECAVASLAGAAVKSMPGSSDIRCRVESRERDDDRA